jgi:glyoxylase-like metal-dependent hydrolase (beta-lactamase superfamily II)
MTDDALPIETAFEGEPGQLVTLSPLVRRMTAPNPGPMTFKGTNTYVVGHGAVTVIDPGPDLPEHVAALTAALAGERVARILVTHTHRDHSPASRALAAATGAPSIGCAPHHPFRAPHPDEAERADAANDLAYVPARVLADGEEVEGDGYTLQAVATPGHTMNHLAFALPQERALFSGDHVMAWSTTVVAPPAGSMAAYMASLDKLKTRDDLVYWPGHGGAVRDPARFLRALQHHRRQRERGILACLRRGEATIPGIVAATYEGLDPRLARAAAVSVLAHLEDLCARGLATAEGGPGVTARYAAAEPQPA